MKEGATPSAASSPNPGPEMAWPGASWGGWTRKPTFLPSTSQLETQGTTPLSVPVFSASAFCSQVLLSRAADRLPCLLQRL